MRSRQLRSFHVLLNSRKRSENCAGAFVNSEPPLRFFSAIYPGTPIVPDTLLPAPNCQHRRDLRHFWKMRTQCAFGLSLGRNVLKTLISDDGSI
jgi:hypothetical protein